MSKHTPGPWELTRGDGYTVVAGIDQYGDRHEIATSYNTHPQEGNPVEEWHPPQEANVRLIAAAPDMLAALKALVADIAACQTAALPGGSTCRRAESAIAKAEGRL